MRLVGTFVIVCKPMAYQAGMLRTPAIQAGIAQLVEHDLAKVGVASSNLVSRSIKYHFKSIVYLLVNCEIGVLRH